MILALLIAAGAFWGIALFMIAVLVICAAIIPEPLFADTPADEFASDDDPVHTCARTHCTLPVYLDSLCEGHYDLLVDATYEFRREIEDYERS